MAGLTSSDTVWDWDQVRLCCFVANSCVHLANPKLLPLVIPRCPVRDPAWEQGVPANQGDGKHGCERAVGQTTSVTCPLSNSASFL